MNNPSPLVPQGSLLDQKNKGRARVKIAVFVVLAIHGIGLLALLMQGCQQKESALPPADTNTVAPPSFVEPTNAPVVEPSNTTSMTTTSAPVAPPVVEPVVPPVTPLPGATEYKVAQGDSFYTIARKFHVTVKAISEANPGVDSTKLKIGQTLHIPAPIASTTAGATASNAVASTGEQVYTVKSGDTLTKIATQQGVSLRALRTLNGLKTDSIKVGQKLKIPAKASSTAPIAAPTESAPAVPGTGSNTTSIPETR